MKILPIHPQPKDGEILSSWMARLAFSNHYQLHTFYSKVLGYTDQIWTRDVDKNTSPQLLALLSSASGVPVERLKAMTLNHFDGLLYEEVRVNGVAEWILPLGVYHRTRKRKGMQCCPICLSVGEPYFRLKWRLSLFTICEVHNCFLIDECPSCGSNIEFHRNGIGGNDYVSYIRLSKCASCGVDLADAVVDYPHAVPEYQLKHYRRILLAVAQNRWPRNLNLPTTHPLSFFYGFRACLAFSHKRSATRLRRLVNERLSLALPLNVNGLEFNFVSLMDRFQLIIIVMWMLRHWPIRFVELIRDSGLSRSRFNEEPDTLPYWLVRALKDHLDYRIYSPTAEEIESAIAFLRRNNRDITATSIARLIGVGIDAIRARHNY